MRQLDVRDMSNVCNQVIAACCIHNFCINENERCGVEEDVNLFENSDTNDAFFV